jgi:hypothetical protein
MSVRPSLTLIVAGTLLGAAFNTPAAGRMGTTCGPDDRPGMPEWVQQRREAYMERVPERMRGAPGGLSTRRGGAMGSGPGVPDWLTERRAQRGPVSERAYDRYGPRVHSWGYERRFTDPRGGSGYMWSRGAESGQRAHPYAGYRPAPYPRRPGYPGMGYSPRGYSAPPAGNIPQAAEPAATAGGTDL